MTAEANADDRPPSLAGAEWLARPETQAVLAALASGGYSARAVGGCVRNALIGVPVKDIDIATTARPEEVMSLAGRAGLKSVPTGLEHGTVTVVAQHIPYEVTTLREDVETFGRHARVAFTVDWAADARRRDFTMNALYCSADGTVHDPLGGYPDLLARRVRFIGDATARIREDYLRILRFYRFNAEHGRGGRIDEQSHLAAVRERAGLTSLSGERIHGELVRLLAAPGAIAAVTDMAECGILQLVLGTVPRLRPLARLAELEHRLGLSADAALRLAALTVGSLEEARHVTERLRLSTAEADKLARASVHAVEYGHVETPLTRKVRLYRCGPTLYREAVLMRWALSNAPMGDALRRADWELPDIWMAPRMPFSGRDVIAAGVPAGPRVGRILAAFEAWWIAADFPSEPGLLRQQLFQALASN